MTTRRCICLFSSLYPPSMGGVETYVSNLARTLVSLGHRTIVVTCTPSGSGEEAGDTGVEVLRLPATPFLAGRYPIPKGGAQAQRIWAWLERQPITDIEVHTRFYPLCPQAIAFAHRKGIVPVVLEHGSAHLTLGNPLADIAVHAVEHYMTRQCLKHPARFYAVSRKASVWLRHFGIASQGELPNSIDADSYIEGASQRNFREELGIGDDATIVAFIGRLVPEKGVLALAEASKELPERSIVICVGGEGPLRRSIERFESASFRLLGRLSRPDTASLLLQADALCLPSRSEGFSTTLLEAAACATCPIATEVGGTDELMPDVDHGIIIPDTSPGTIVSALEAAQADRERLKALGANAAQLVRASFSWKNAAEKTLRACREANGD